MSDPRSAREPLVRDAAASTHSFLREIGDILRIMVPIFMGMVSWVAMKVTDTAVLGHVGQDSRYLEAAALSDLWTSATGVFIQSRVIGTFCGQAYGAGNKMLVGAWVQVAYVVLFSVMVPVAVCWLFTAEVVRDVLHKREQESQDAGYYAVVLAICLPVRILFSQLTAFFSVQKIMWPSTVCSAAGMLTNLVGSLVLVLGLGLGFEACPWVTTTVEYLQLLLLWFVACYCLQLHRECWPGWSRKHVTKERLMRYFKMYFPAACAIGSDFWRVTVIGAVASNIGDNPDEQKRNLSVFNVGYRICWMCLTLVGALGAAIGIQVSTSLGTGRTAKAKHSCVVGTCMALSVLVVLCIAIVAIPRQLGAIFSNDAAILDKFEECKWPLAAFAFFMNLSVQLEAIPMAGGKVNAVFYAGLAGSWLGQVPGVLLLTKYWRADIVGLYTGATAGYALVVVLYALITLNLDWEQLVVEARERSEVGQRQGSRAPESEGGEGGVGGADAEPLPRTNLVEAELEEAGSGATKKGSAKPPDAPQPQAGLGSPPSAEDLSEVQEGPRPKPRPACRFGDRCNRRNLRHWIEESHPGDPDFTPLAPMTRCPTVPSDSPLPRKDGSYKWLRFSNFPDERSARCATAVLTLEVCRAGGYEFATSSGSQRTALQLKRLEDLVGGTRIVTLSDVTSNTATASRSQPKVTVVENTTALECGLSRMADHEASVAVLSAASSYHPSGGFRTGGQHALEEAMCTQSSLCLSLQRAVWLALGSRSQEVLALPENQWLTYIPEDGVVLSPYVEVFRSGTESGYVFLPQPTCLKAVVSVAMPNRNPKVRDSPVDVPSDPVKYAQLLETKVTVALGAARLVGAKCVVVPALGCGVFQNKPADVGSALARALAKGAGAGLDEVVLAGVPSEFADAATGVQT